MSNYVMRTGRRCGPWLLTGAGWLSAAYLAAIVPADHVMGQQMLHGVKARAEGLRPARQASSDGGGLGREPRVVGSASPSAG